MSPGGADATTFILLLMLVVLIPVLPASIYYDLKHKQKIRKKQESRNERS